MLTVTQVERHHLRALAELFNEMERFYGATDIASHEELAAQIESVLFSDDSAVNALIAYDDDAAVGFAAYSFLWPAVGVTRSLYLKELYVSEQHRTHGAGRFLMEHITEVARENQCSRVEWMTDDDNPGAQRFYAALGFSVNKTKLFYRVDLQYV